jgi:anti-sigma B factor antagonist
MLFSRSSSSLPLCHYGDHFALRASRDPGSYVLEVYGELDVHTAGLLESRIEDAESTSADHVLVDLSGVDFMASAGLKVLAAADARSRSTGHTLGLLRPPADVQCVLERVGLADCLPFRD